MYKSELQTIEAELGSIDAKAMFGPLSIEIAAAIAGGVPVVGPIIGVFLKRFGDASLSPDLKNLLLRTVWEIEQLVPEVAKVATLEERIAIMESRKGEDAVSALLEKAAFLASQTDDAVRFHTHDGTLLAQNVVIEDREFLSSASGASHVDLSNLTQSGALGTVSTSKGATQILNGASFRRADPKAATSTHFGADVNHLGGQTDFNVREDGKSIAVRHVTNGSNGFGLRISVGPNGRSKIEFG